MIKFDPPMSTSKVSAKNTALVRPLFIYNATNAVNLSTPLHKHDFCQILYLYEGRAEVKVGEVLYALKAGSFLVIHPGQLHQFYFPTAKEVRVSVCQIKVYFREDFFEWKSLPSLVDTALFRSELETVLDLILKVNGSRFLDVEQSLSGLYLYLFQIIKACASSRPSDKDLDFRIKSALHLIHTQPERHFSVADLSKAVSLDESYFIRLFRKNLGVSPVRYIIDKRMERAKNLMLFSSAGLQEVARETGYDYYHHFSNQFKKWSGVTPKQFKKKVKNGEE